MTEKAAIDRFEGHVAVLIVGEDERRVNVPRESLPRGAKEGAWLQVEFLGEQLVSATMDEGETERAKTRIAEKLARLRKGEHLE